MKELETGLQTSRELISRYKKKKFFESKAYLEKIQDLTRKSLEG